MTEDAGDCRYASYHTDHLGTPLALTDEQGNVLWEARPDDWAAVSDPQGSTSQPIRYQGQYEDEESGLYYNRHRYYDPQLGRYVNQDPIGLLGGMNSYAYPHAPTGWVDPLGLEESNGFFPRAWKRVTGWHYEGRAGRNVDLPTYEQATSEGSGWQLLSEAQSVFHDNGIGKPELKFINPDGREVVYDGDTLDIVSDPCYLGTYNYVNPAPVPDRWYDMNGWRAWAAKGAGHLVLDVAPYGIGDNVRGGCQ